MFIMILFFLEKNHLTQIFQQSFPIRHMLSNAMLKEYPVTQSHVNKVTGLDGFSKVKQGPIPFQVLESLIFHFNAIRCFAPSGCRTSK